MSIFIEGGLFLLNVLSDELGLKYSYSGIKTFFFFTLSGVELNPEAEGFSGSIVSNNLLENLTHGEIIYPEICMLGLNLLSASKAKLDVLAHVFESFLKIVRQKEKNISLLIQQVKDVLC